jgi:6-phosphofructokinase 1
MKSGIRGVMFVVTENIYGINGLPTLNEIADEVGKLTNNQMCRAVVLGHIQRGGIPTGNDRFMASLFGAEVINCVKKDITNVTIGYRDGKIITTDIKEAVSMPSKKHNFYFISKNQDK